MTSIRARLARSPFLLALAIGTLALVVALAPFAWQALRGGPAPTPGMSAPREAPWTIEQPASGQTRVFGLTLPGATFGEARTRWGEDLRGAVIAPPGGAPVLEGYVERFDAGGITGRLLLSFDADPTALARWRDAVPGAATESGARRHALGDAARAEAAAAALVGITFIPAAQLDGDILAARFGQPSERLRENQRLEHWLYPALGLAVALDSDGKDLLQYVSPGDFEPRLAAPLRAAAARPDPSR
jgi:hypothetical protein